MNKIFFGPVNPGSTLEQLRLPEVVTKEVKYASGLVVGYTIKFDGKILRVSSMNVTSDRPYGILISSLIKLKIPKILQDLVYEYNPEVHTLIASGEKSTEFLSQLYWAEYVCSGTPRESFRKQLSLSRNAANARLRKLEARGLVPSDRARRTVKV
jgi:hypothetical protein